MTRTRFLWLFITSIMSVEAFAQSPEPEVLVFGDKFSETVSSAPVVLPVLPKARRLSKDAGKIEIWQEEGNPLPENVLIAVKYAINQWESALKNQYPIRFKFIYTDELTDISNDIEVMVNYSQESGINYSNALYNNRNGWVETKEDKSPDAVIRINSLKKWDVGYSDDTIIRSSNLASALLRGIAIGLGFGSSVRKDSRQQIGFGVRVGYSVFDHLIVSSDGKRLDTIKNNGTRKNPELEAFTQPESGTSLYVRLSDDEQFRLYAPNVFERYRSLVYLDQPDALMHHAISQGDKNMQVDHSTTAILNAIGWNIDEKNIIEIVGEGIGDNGLASAYEPHSFSVKCNSPGSISDALWIYKLPLIDGTFETVVQKNNVLSIEIPAVVNPDDYEIDINGCIPGEISFTGVLAGREVSARYKVFLALKPRIKNVTITDKISNSPFATYDIHYTVEYVGCDELYVTVEEEFGAIGASYIKEPFLAHVVSSKIKAPYYALVTISASNEYGTDEYYIDLEPFDGNNDNPEHSSEAAIDSIIDNETVTIDVYDIFGNILHQHISGMDISSLSKGFYILRIINTDGTVNSIKHIKQ